MLPSSSSSSSATVRVDKATSDLLIGPDWTMNMEICDSINSNHWDAKDVVKAVKKRLQHKNPKVQLLALTLLETMVKNCGDYVHFQIADRHLLQEMFKIVKKKTDMHVRDKILVLLDSWQEAFGGPGGKYPQYYWAYEELRRSGVIFPRRSPDAAPIFTPPVSHRTLRHAQAGNGMPNNFSTRLDETMATEVENLSLSSINSMRNVLDLLADMLQAVNPSNRVAVKDEVIVDLVYQCRTNQKKLMQMLTTAGDEELLSQGLELNDSLQTVLAKHDAISSGSPLPTQLTKNFSPQSVDTQDSSPRSSGVREPGQAPLTKQSTPVVTVTRSQLEEEEDDFAQLARRHSKMPSYSSQETFSEANEGLTLVNGGKNTLSTLPADSPPVANNALALTDPPSPIKTTKEQDIIDLLSITLTTATASPQTPRTPTSSSYNIHQLPLPSTTQGYDHASQAYPENQGQAAFNSYAVPWAQAQPLPHSQFQQQPPSLLQPQPQPQPPRFQSQSQPQTHLHFHPQAQAPAWSQSQPQPQPQSQSQFQTQPQLQSQPQPQFQPQTQSQSHTQSQFQTQPQLQLQPQPDFQPPTQPHTQSQFQTQPQLQPRPQFQPQTQTPKSQSHSQANHQAQANSQLQYQPHVQSQAEPQFLQFSSGYPPPPWAPTPGYFSNQNQSSATPYLSSTPLAIATTSSLPMSGARPLQHSNSFPAKVKNMVAINGEPRANMNPRFTAPSAGQKPFIPSYRLFEDLNVLSNPDGKFKTDGASPSLAGTSSQGMVGWRK